MRNLFLTAVIILMTVLPFHSAAQSKRNNYVSAPMVIDHNRMIIEAEMQRKNGSWRTVRLWVDTGSPSFYMTEALAVDLGIDISGATEKERNGSFEIESPKNIRIGAMSLNLNGVSSSVKFQPYWLYTTMHIDGNLPATVLKKYQVIINYPVKEFTIAEPGSLPHRGEKIPIMINPATGIAQADLSISGEKFNLAIDLGASYSFTSEEIINRIVEKNKNISVFTGAFGCANMWGWWPRNESEWKMIRVPEIKLGPFDIDNAGLVGLPNVFSNGMSVGEWYSGKTAKAVNGFAGPNLFKAFRLEIDYQNNLLYLSKEGKSDSHDMDLAGISVRQLPDGSYQVLSIAERDGKPLIKGIKPEDIIISIEKLITTGATMGKVADALRGKPGETKTILVERNNKQFTVKAEVLRLL